MKWHVLIEETMQLVRATNRYFESSAPWSLVKSDKESAGTVLRNCLEALRVTAVLFYPIMPGKMTDLLTRIGEPIQDYRLDKHAVWGLVRNGAKIRKGDALFPRLDEKEVKTALADYLGDKTEKKAKVEAAPVTIVEGDQISLDDFKKIQLRTAKVLEAEKISGSDKLLKLQIEVGEERRQIVAGIAEHYTPDQMVGKQIVIVANLKPAKLRGELSEGMLLAVKWDGKLEVLSPAPDAPSNSPIS